MDGGGPVNDLMIQFLYLLGCHGPCKACLVARTHRQLVNCQPSTSDTTLQPGEKLMADIWGPVATVSLGSASYLHVVIDPSPAWGWCQVYGMRAKSEASSRFASAVLYLV